MIIKGRFLRVFTLIFAAGLFATLIAPFATSGMRAAATSYYVNPAGNDSNDGRSAGAPLKTIQKAIDLAQPGAVITLAPGVYLQDVHSARAGAAGTPITLTGPAEAIVKGAGGARIIEINHDNITLSGFTIDGLWGDPNSLVGYRDKLLYVLGKQPRDGVSGLRVFKMTLRNAGGECVRLRYFAQHNEISDSSITNCGVHDFRFKAGGKNGEGIYIGTAPEQRGDGKNPTAEPDLSNENWIHHNRFDTQGNECVDIKESAAGNLIEGNICTGQRDPNSGGFDSRGSGNIFRANQSYGNVGAGIRLGGDTASDGIGNDIYGNSIHDNQAGGIKVMRQPQGQVCGNTMSNNTGGDSVGSYASSLRPTLACSTTPATPPPSTSTPQPAPTAVPIPTSTARPAPTSTTQPVPTNVPAPTSVPGSTGAGCPRRYTVDGSAAALIEAELYSTRNGRFVETTDATRGGGMAMTIPGIGMHKDRATYLSFDLDVTNGGKFYVWLLGYGPDDSADSFTVQFDKGKTKVVNLPRDGWGWKRISGTLALADGAHTLLIKNREDGSSVDRLVLTRDQRYTPADLGNGLLVPRCK
jgi:hypothetical protein